MFVFYPYFILTKYVDLNRLIVLLLVTNNLKKVDNMYTERYEILCTPEQKKLINRQTAGLVRKLILNQDLIDNYDFFKDLFERGALKVITSKMSESEVKRLEEI